MESVENKEKIILDLCGGSGAWSKPYRDAGYTVYNITLPYYDLFDVHCYNDKRKIFFNSRLNNLHFHLNPNDVYGILAAPDCSEFSLAKTRAQRDFKKGLELVNKCIEIIQYCRLEPQYHNQGALQFWALENPTGFLRQFMGIPPFTFDPWHFGDMWKKQTDIWGYFNFPKKNTSLPGFMESFIEKNKTTNLGGSNKNKKIKRSITPPGFANAFFKVNQ